MNDIFAEEEARLRAAYLIEKAAEDAAYAALPQSEKDRLQAERDAFWSALADACEAAVDEDEDDDWDGIEAPGDTDGDDE